jgi:hypothetical protein
MSSSCATIFDANTVVHILPMGMSLPRSRVEVLYGLASKNGMRMRHRLPSPRTSLIVFCLLRMLIFPHARGAAGASTLRSLDQAAFANLARPSSTLLILTVPEVTLASLRAVLPPWLWSLDPEVRSFSCTPFWFCFHLSKNYACCCSHVLCR